MNVADAPQYEPFELLIANNSGDGYPVFVVESPAGNAKSICTLAADDVELRDALRVIENGVDPIQWTPVSLWRKATERSP